MGIIEEEVLKKLSREGWKSKDQMSFSLVFPTFSVEINPQCVRMGQMFYEN